ncbi:MAG: hypothetical protein AAF479_11060 [Pseudomonadota bacterium]
MRIVLALLFFLLSLTAKAQTYSAPEGCEHLVTVRSETCVTSHMSSCQSQMIEDRFVDGQLRSRSFWQHPTLFTLMQSVSGAVAGHKYGDGTPVWGTRVAPGEVYRYRRRVQRNFTTGPEPGDHGDEVMTVREATSMAIGTRTVEVMPLDYEVIGDDGDYKLTERSFLLNEPRIVIGSTCETFDGQGNSKATGGDLPGEIVFPGEPGFGAHHGLSRCGSVTS